MLYRVSMRDLGRDEGGRRRARWEMLTKPVALHNLRLQSKPTAGSDTVMT